MAHTSPRPTDPPMYPSEDEVAETLLHFRIRSLLHLLVQAWYAGRGELALALTDQFVYWVEGDPHQNLAPDLLVLPGEDPERSVASWKVWEEAARPTFALEVVSDDLEKDYVQNPPKYGELGVRELVIYDPLVGSRGGGRRVRWQVYRWVGGAFVEVARTNVDRVESEALGCWLVEVGEGAARRVRLATGPEGTLLVPTPEEEARAALASVQAEAASERQRAESLEAEVERLREALRELRGR